MAKKKLERLHNILKTSASSLSDDCKELGQTLGAKAICSEVTKIIGNENANTIMKQSGLKKVLAKEQAQKVVKGRGMSYGR